MTTVRSSQLFRSEFRSICSIRAPQYVGGQRGRAFWQSLHGSLAKTIFDHTNDRAQKPYNPTVCVSGNRVIFNSSIFNSRV